MRQSVDLVNQIGSAAPDDVIESIHAVMHLFRSQQYRALRGGPHEMTHMDARVLGFFARHPGATQSELAAHSGRDKGQLARLIGGLKERGLLQAQPDESDRRSLHLSLTAQGRAVHQGLQRRARRLADIAVAGLSDDERAQVVTLLRRIGANLEHED